MREPKVALRALGLSREHCVGIRACEQRGAHRESACAYGGNASGYLFDEVGNLTEVIDPQSGSTTFVYDAENRLTTRTLPNGVVTTYTYDARDRPLSVVHRNASNVVLVSRTYVRAPGGEPTRITKEDGSYVEIGYDAALRITSERYYTAAGVLEEELGYTYDADGNRLTKARNGAVSTYSYAAGSRLVGVSTEGELEARVTDNGGRETSLVVDGQQLSLTYDSDDHVTRVVDGSATTEFAFDALGRRTRVSSNSVEHRYLVAPSAELFESPQAISDNAGNVLASFVYAGEHPLLRMENGHADYYLSDLTGSVLAMVDESGAATRMSEYDAFGNARAAEPGAIPGDFGFQGMWRDASGLYYARARLYDPETGRFTSRDAAPGSVMISDSLLPYAFAFSNPHLYRDPTGLFTLNQSSISISISRTLSAVLNRTPTIARQVVRVLSDARTFSRFLYDTRKFKSISRAYWRARGPANGRSLHHWLIPQRWDWVPSAVRNAGFNLLEMPSVINFPGGLNSWMGFAMRWGGARMVLAESLEWTIRVGILSAASGGPYAVYRGLSSDSDGDGDADDEEPRWVDTNEDGLADE